MTIPNPDPALAYAEAQRNEQAPATQEDAAA